MRLLLLFVTVLTLTWAYDFNDEFYNQLIVRELDEIQDYIDSEKYYNHRTKREEIKPETGTKDVIKEPVKEPAKEPAKEPVKEPVKEPAKEPAKEPVKEPTKEPVKEPAKEVLKVSKDEVKEDVKPEATQSGQDKCKRKRFRMCCGEEIAEAVFEKDRELKRECYKEVTELSKDDKVTVYDPLSCEKVNKTKKEWTCVMQCVGQKKNLLDDNGALKVNEALEWKRNEFGGKDEWFLNLIEQAFPVCVKEVEGVKFVKDVNDKLSCNPSAMKMHHCMWREIQLTCPDGKIKDAKSCSKIREKLRKHVDFSLFRHAHVHDDE